MEEITLELSEHEGLGWIFRWRARWRRITVIPRCAVGWLAHHRATTHVLLGFLSLALGIVVTFSAGIPAPTVHDEFTYLLAADTFAHGRLTNPPHPMWRYFDTFHVLQHPTYMSKYYPGQGGVMALGQVITGEPFYGVLLSGALMCGALSYFFFAWMRPRKAVMAGFFSLFTFGVLTYWTNTYWGGCVAAAGGALAFGAVRQLFLRRTWRDPFLLGAGIVLLTTTRLAECVVILPILVGVIAWWFWRDSAARGGKLKRVIFPLAACSFLLLAFYAYYDYRITGSPFSLPYAVHFQQYEMIPATFFGTVSPEPHYVAPVMQKFYTAYKYTLFRSSFNWSGILAQEREKWREFESFFGRHLLLPRWLAVVLILLPLWIVKRKWALLAYGACFAISSLHVVCVYYMPHYSAPVLALGLALWLLGLRRIGIWRFRGFRVGRAICHVYFAAVVAVFVFHYTVDVATHRTPTDYVGSFSTSSPLQERLRVEQEALRQSDGRRVLILVRYSPEHEPTQEWVYNGASPDDSPVVWARDFGEAGDQDILRYYKERVAWYFDADSNHLASALPAQPG